MTVGQTIGLVGRKCGMTRVFTEDGRSIPVTVIQALPNRVTRIKTPDSDGYAALQVTSGTVKPQRLSRPDAGQFTAVNAEPGEGLWEFRITPEQIEERNAAMCEGYKSAARVPLRTAELCNETLKLCLTAAQIGNDAVMSDAGVGALMALAGVQGAIYNVRINLPHTNDSNFVAEMSKTLDELLEQGKETCGAVQHKVEASFEK